MRGVSLLLLLLSACALGGTEIATTRAMTRRSLRGDLRDEHTERIRFGPIRARYEHARDELATAAAVSKAHDCQFTTSMLCETINRDVIRYTANLAYAEHALRVSQEQSVPTAPTGHVIDGA